MARRNMGRVAAAAAVTAAVLLLGAAAAAAFAAPAAPAGTVTAGAAAASPAVLVAAAPSCRQGLGSAAAGAGGGLGAAGAALVVLAAAALIVQNKGGGHGELGYHLALKLSKDKGLKVTMVNDSAAKKNKPPFDSYADLEAAGVDVRWADLAGGGLAAALEGVGPCEYVFDNQNVCPGEVQKAVASWSPKAYAYVSSGGMYKVTGDGPLVETGPVKEDNKQLAVERSAAEQGLNWSAYRPQYIYGPKTNKRDYIDWFLDRITRDLPIPLPADGSLTTTLTHAEDVAGLLASVVGKESAAKGQVFNCATDVRLSHKALVQLIAKAAGKDPEAVLQKAVYYDPAKLKGVELPKEGKFPLRETHFAVGVEKAKELLGWAPTHRLEEDLAWYVEDYKRLGKDKGDVVRAWDEALISAAV